MTAQSILHDKDAFIRSDPNCRPGGAYAHMGSKPKVQPQAGHSILDEKDTFIRSGQGFQGGGFQGQGAQGQSQDPAYRDEPIQT